MTKFILDMDDDDHDDDLFLAGIISQTPDYQLVYLLNKHLGTNFVDSISPFTHKTKKAESQYRLFYNKECINTPEAFLINNQSFNEFDGNTLDTNGQISQKLIKHANKFDFFLISHDISLLEALKNSLFKSYIITHLIIDFESLNKNESLILNNIIFHKYEQG